MEELLKILNTKQREAVLTTEGPLLVLSGAGSGKTKVITTRIAHLINEGVPPYNILAITFTNKGAKEMQQRVKNLLKNDENVWISTFHSMCVRILRQDIHLLGFDTRFIIYDASDSERLVKETIKLLNFDEKNFPPKGVMSLISSLKDELKTPEMYEKEIGDNYRDKKHAEIYKLYQQTLKKNNALDFDDIIVKTVELFLEDKHCLAKYQNRFKYIMVDEYQDTNTAQYKLISLLAKEHGNICVVGDDDQSIYGWRGANIRNILDFEKDFKNAKIIKLEENYRSTKNILSAANSVIKNNSQRKSKTLWTQKEDGQPVEYYNAADETKEALYVVAQIKKHKLNYGKCSDVGILYRQHSLSRAIEEQLVRANIPYKIFGGTRFYDRKEIKDILAYIKIIYNPSDAIAIKRVINVPKRGIGDTSVDRLTAFAAANDMSFFDVLKNFKTLDVDVKSTKIPDFVKMIEYLQGFAADNTVAELIDEVIRVTNYESELEKEDEVTKATRLDNIAELINKAVEFENTYGEAASLDSFLEEVALVADIDNYSDDDETATLMTIHSAKGLEFPLVFLIGFEDGIFPSYRTLISDNSHELEEERRLCYVALTRAEEKLYISSASSRMHNGKTLHNTRSRFFGEISPEFIKEAFDDATKVDTEKQTARMSQFAAVKIFNDKKSPQMGAVNYKKHVTPQNKNLDFVVGDTVSQMKYGNGTVRDIQPAGADYEVTIEFEGIGTKKFFAFLSKLKKV